MKRHYVSTLILTAGTLGGTAVSAVAAESSWLVLAGPLLLAAAIVGAGVWERGAGASPGASVRRALILATLFAITGVIMWLRNPSQVPFTVAVLGGTAVVILGGPRRQD